MTKCSLSFAAREVPAEVVIKCSESDHVGPMHDAAERDVRVCVWPCQVFDVMCLIALSRFTCGQQFFAPSSPASQARETCVICNQTRHKDKQRVGTHRRLFVRTLNVEM